MEEKFNFSQVAALVVDSDRYSTGIVGQILRGFGMTRQRFVATGLEAKKQLAVDKFDLVICESVLPDMNASAFIRWVRRHQSPAIRYLPIVMLTGYAQYTNVTASRDAGANSFVRKPVAPIVLFDHIVWSARTERPFIEADGYAGPCRRFKYGEPAPGLNRRITDHYAEPDGGARKEEVENQEPVNP